MSAPISSEAFRKVLSQFATGVTVITTGSADNRTGMTANSFNSVSINPPLILWSVSKQARGYHFFREAKTFVAHILADNQQNLSQQFASAGADKFAGVEVDQTSYGPFIHGCAAFFCCSTWAVYPGGDHDIIVGQVERFENAGLDTLIFAQGKYRRLL